MTKEFPTRLSFYQTPPTHTITLEEFEELVMLRLKLLKGLESASARSATEPELIKLYGELSKRTIPLTSSNFPDKRILHKERQNDQIAHFGLRLGFCKNEESRSWFIRMEALLFRLRFLDETESERALFLRNSNIETISSEEAQQFGLSLNYYKVPFEKVYELISKRSVFLRNGYAFVSDKEKFWIVVNDFKAFLAEQLLLTSKALPNIVQDERLIPVTKDIHTQYNGRDYSKSSDKLTASDVDTVKEHFPPCMRHLYVKLKEDGHLKHGGRMQFGLFLKGIGLSMEEALEFWKQSFFKVTGDVFNKQYAYNIRHNYGREGKRMDYTPFSCIKIIKGNALSTGDHHGCPYAHFASDALKNHLTKTGLPPVVVNEAVDLARKGHHQVACTRVLEYKVQENGKKLGETVTHPNMFYGISKTGEWKKE